MTQPNHFGCTDLSQILMPSFIGNVAANASSAWFDSRGDVADTANHGKLRLPSRAVLLIVFPNTNANNNFTLQGSNSASGANPVNLAKPTVTNAAGHAVDIVELPTHRYRYFRVNNPAGSSAAQLILLRYNDREFHETPVKVYNEAGNIYRYTGQTE